jgi:leucyl-tRNA synthetase
VEGSARFLNRVWRLLYEQHGRVQGAASVASGTAPEGEAKLLRQKTHRTIKRVTEDIERFHFNTAISAIMELVNEIYVSAIKESAEEAAIRVMREAVETVVVLLSPFVPHFAEELWQALGNSESIVTHPWPKYDPEMVAEEEVLIVIQVNGKLRDRMTVPVAYGEEQVKEWALKSDRIKSLLGGKPVRRVIFVPQKLVNIVC